MDKIVSLGSATIPISREGSAKIFEVPVVLSIVGSLTLSALQKSLVYMLNGMASGAENLCELPC